MDKKKKQTRKQNIFLYRFVQFLSWFVAIFAFKRKFLRNEIRGKKGPFVIIANHEASLDFVNLIGSTMTPLTFVISNSFYSTLPFKKIISGLGMIPKQQFQTTLKDLAAMRKTLKDGKILVIYPAGLMCEDGNSTPIPAATYEFLRWLDADIYVAKTIGTYFSMPKWAKGGIRRGRTYIDLYKLFEKEELKHMNVDEIKAKTTEALDFDAYLDQEKLRVKYKIGDNIEGLENVLYLCPNCMSEFTMRIRRKKTIYCKQCGFEETSDKYAFLHNNKGIGDELRHVSKWSKLIYNHLRERVENGIETGLSTMARIQTINQSKRKYTDIGTARVSMNRNFITIKGELNNNETEIKIPTSTYPTLPFKPGRHFELQHGDISYRCHPKNSKTVMKWVNMVKVYYELANPETAKTTATV